MVGLWLFSQTRLGPGPRQQGRQVQEPDSRKIKVALARARDGVHQEGLVSALRGTRSACFSGVAGCPRWDGESPRQDGRSCRPGWELGKGTSLPRFDLSNV
jgi:hypothetical protein